MTKILRVDASIKGAQSVSRQLTDRIIARLRANHPDAEITHRDLSAGVTPVDGKWIGAVFTPEDKRDAAQNAIVAYSDALLAELRAADIVVIGMPVYNFGVPSQLKSWIDQLARQGETFVYSEAGAKGLLGGKRAIIAMASDGTPQGSSYDFASGYMRHMMNFFGIDQVEIVAADAIALEPQRAVPKALEAVEALVL